MADSAKRIDFNWLLRSGKVALGCWGRTILSWNRRGQPAGSITVEYDMTDPLDSWLTLRFTVTRYGEAKGAEQVQRVRCSYTVPNYGGRRWWMHCPQTGRRVAKLYMPDGGGTFASRQAWGGLAYQSQRAAHHDRPFEALFRVQRRLGCTEGWEVGLRRPKGMWRRTFDQHRQRYDDLDDMCSAIMAGYMLRLGRG